MLVNPLFPIARWSSGCAYNLGLKVDQTFLIQSQVKTLEHLIECFLTSAMDVKKEGFESPCIACSAERGALSRELRDTPIAATSIFTSDGEGEMFIRSCKSFCRDTLLAVTCT